jgi:hypothetical protein
MHRETLALPENLANDFQTRPILLSDFHNNERQICLLWFLKRSLFGQFPAELLLNEDMFPHRIAREFLQSHLA